MARERLQHFTWSIKYQLNTPSWTNNGEKHNSKRFFNYRRFRISISLTARKQQMPDNKVRFGVVTDPQMLLSLFKIKDLNKTWNVVFDPPFQGRQKIP